MQRKLKKSEVLVEAAATPLFFLSATHLDYDRLRVFLTKIKTNVFCINKKSVVVLEHSSWKIRR